MPTRLGCEKSIFLVRYPFSFLNHVLESDCFSQGGPDLAPCSCEMRKDEDTFSQVVEACRRLQEWPNNLLPIEKSLVLRLCRTLSRRRNGRRGRDSLNES